MIRAASGRSRWRVVSLGLLVLAGLGPGVWGAAFAAASTSVEYRIKAAMLYNFTRFIQWPAGGQNAAGQMAVCVLGQDPFGEALDAVAGKQTQGKVLVVRRVGGPDDLAGCQVVFVSASESARAGSILRRLADLPLLTVSDMQGFTQMGGMIGFTLLQNKVRFGINLEAARRAGLSISSKLLRLAVDVEEGPR